MLFSIRYIARVAFFLYFRKQMKAAPPKGKQMKGSRIEVKWGSAGSCAPSMSHFKVAFRRQPAPEESDLWLQSHRVTRRREDLALSMRNAPSCWAKSQELAANTSEQRSKHAFLRLPTNQIRYRGSC
jgi:hypothetical protein